MIVIGLEKYRGLVYEGDGSYGAGIWPTPMITTAKFVQPSDKKLEAQSSSSPYGCRFREDSFDPIARIRRGRFYETRDSLTKEWKCTPHPNSFFDAVDPQNKNKTKSLETFYMTPIYSQHIRGKKELPIVLLGVDDSFTSWTIVNIERIFTGEDLVTLKAKSSFGLLPTIYYEKIPLYFRSKLSETLDMFADEIHRSSPISVIDRAREVATYALLSFYNLQKGEAVDLGELIKELEKDKYIVAVNTSSIIARLHARAKPSEQEKRELLPIREKDADLAVNCVGTLLREIGFADWV